MSCRIEALEAGSAALHAAGEVRVFASFGRSCYVESDHGIACVGPGALGRGPLNILIREYPGFREGDRIDIDVSLAQRWTPPAAAAARRGVPVRVAAPWRRHPQAQAFLRWIRGAGRPDDALIGLGPGLTPSGDDFVGGAMIALRAAGEGALADRIAAWALPLAATRTGRISRAHLACAARGEGHEALHALLGAVPSSARFEESLAWLGRLGHTSGLDAAAGALLALAARALSAAPGPSPCRAAGTRSALSACAGGSPPRPTRRSARRR